MGNLFLQRPASGRCSIQVELSVAKDGAVFSLKIQSMLDYKVIGARTEVVMICPTCPVWNMLHKYTYYDHGVIRS